MNRNKIIFLDIDGVLNFNHCPSRNSHDCMGLEQENIKVLNKILLATDAAIVLSSSWRKFNDLVNDILNSNIIDIKIRIIDKTPSFSMGGRGDEILDWLTKNKFTGRFAVIDDCVWDIENVIQLDSIFEIDSAFGLTDDDANRIIKHLNK